MREKGMLANQCGGANGRRGISALAGLLCLIGLAACTDEGTEPGSLASADPLDVPLTTASVRTFQRNGIFIQLPAGLPEELASHLLARFQEASIGKQLPLARTGTIPELTVKGVARAGTAPEGTAVALVWEVLGPDGKRVKLISGDALIPNRSTDFTDRYDPWASVDSATLENIADTTALELADWYSQRWLGAGSDADFATASVDAAPAAADPIDFTTPSIIQRSPPKSPQHAGGPERQMAAIEPVASRDPGNESAAPVQKVTPAAGNRRAFFDVAVGTSPGDSQLSLAAAVQEALLNAQAPDTGPRAYRVIGDVKLEASSVGMARIRIEWTVTAKDGTPLGLVTQANEVEARAIAGPWGDIAAAAGSAAAAGILELIGADGPPA